MSASRSARDEPIARPGQHRGARRGVAAGRERPRARRARRAPGRAGAPAASSSPRSGPTTRRPRATGLFQILDEERPGRSRARARAVARGAARSMYTGMLRSRLLDQRLLPLQRQGRIGFYIGATGQEAGVIAGAHAIGPEDYFVPGLRETSAALYRGLPAAHLPGADLRQRQRPRPGPADALPLGLARQPPRRHVLVRVQPAAPRHRHRHGRQDPRATRSWRSATAATAAPARRTSTSP